MREIFFLTCGSFVAPAAAIAPPGLRSRLGLSRMSNTVAVIVRDDGDVTLVDAGWSREACAAPRRTIGLFRSALLGMHVRPGDAIADQLRSLDIQPSQVKTILATHLHLDHIGGACDFPNASVVCTLSELSAARGRRSQGYRAKDLEGDRFRPVELRGPGSYGFSAGHDVFGDGELVLLDGSGHTEGSVAVAICARDRYYLHAGDMVYQTWEYGPGPGAPSLVARFTAWRREQLVQRYGSLRAAEADARRPVIVPSHDAVTLERLPRAPHSAAG